MLRIALQVCLFLVLVGPGFAEDWVATRLRGTAEQMVRGQWIPLERGARVLDGQSVRTGADGRVDLTRGTEIIQLSAGTQIEVHEGAGKLTSIEMSAGMITAEVERRNVQHFSVQTTYLAAIVKGTIFRVSLGGGSAHVAVDRGTVQVQDLLNDLVVDIVQGQEAQVSQSQPLEVAGPGAVAVFNFEGERVVNGTSDVPADDRGRPADVGMRNPPRTARPAMPTELETAAATGTTVEMAIPAMAAARAMGMLTGMGATAVTRRMTAVTRAAPGVGMAVPAAAAMPVAIPAVMVMATETAVPAAMAAGMPVGTGRRTN